MGRLFRSVRECVDGVVGERKKLPGNYKLQMTTGILLGCSEHCWQGGKTQTNAVRSPPSVCSTLASRSTDCVEKHGCIKRDGLRGCYRRQVLDEYSSGSMLRSQHLFQKSSLNIFKIRNVHVSNTS